MECPVCFNQYAFLQKLKGCQHSLCKTCLESWREKSETCPFCRRSLKKRCVAVLRIWHESHIIGAQAYVENMKFDRDTEYVKIALTTEELPPKELSAAQIFYRHA